MTVELQIRSSALVRPPLWSALDDGDLGFQELVKEVGLILAPIDSNA